MTSSTCPYCDTTYLLTDKLHSTYFGNFKITKTPLNGPVITHTIASHTVDLFCCPKCKKVHTIFHGYGEGWGDDFTFYYSPATAMHLPDYIPQQIREDYLEAIQIADLSPKASATLARRCLQGMIHDFWGIKEKNLNAEITKLKENIPAKQWQAIDALRKIGNIGAHMEKDVELIVDVDPDEARKLLKVIELLFKNWYIADHEDNQLLDEVKAMSDEKEAARLAGRDTAGGEQLPIQ